MNGHLIGCRRGVTDGPGALGGTHLIDAVAVGLDNLGPVRYGNARNPFSGLRVFDDAHQGAFFLDFRSLYRVSASGKRYDGGDGRQYKAILEFPHFFICFLAG